MSGAPQPFDLTGPLPSGTTVLEASAGTGKTFTIAALAARYVAEGVATVDQLMIVTFGRAATSELRDRVRERFTTAAAGLADPAGARVGDDELLQHLATGTDAEVGTRRHRLLAAVTGFDTATISTTHGFCAQMLATLGIAADVDADAVLTESTADLRTEVVADCYVRAFCTDDTTPALEAKQAREAARAAFDDPHARLEPSGPPGSDALLRKEFGDAVRAEIGRRKRDRRLLDYDDLLSRLRDALLDPTTGAAARRRVRSRFRLVLVDEFQDTDPVQWEILRAAFDGERTLVLIGDPKQAIYAFRGGDVITYLAATAAAGATATLATNRRADAPLVTALQALLEDTALGDPRIRVHPVAASHLTPRLAGAPGGAPLRLRLLPRPEPDQEWAADAARQRVITDLVADVTALLESPAQLTVDGAPPRPVRPADLAVLVQRNSDGVAVRDALQAAGIPVVLAMTSSVFAAEAAAQWLTLLRALDGADRPALVRSAALTTFVGWDLARLAAASEPDLDALGDRCRAWADVLSRDGVAALWEVLTASGLIAQVLSRPRGERLLTDLRHVAQALHAAAHVQHLGVSSLVTWLDKRIAEAAQDEAEERSRRLDTDAHAVQVLTVHRAKGLQFPVVYLPFLWNRWLPPEPDALRLHDPDGTRVLDVGGRTGAGRAERKLRAQAEDDGESLRLAYVALTRACSAVVAWWVPTKHNTAAAPLHRLLFAPRGADGTLPGRHVVPTDGFARSHLRGLAQRAGGLIAVEDVRPSPRAVWTPPPADAPSIAVRAFERTLDRLWTRTSYTGLTADTHAPVLSEPEEPGTTDEPAEQVGEPVTEEPERATTGLPSPFSGLPAGAAFGTAVHRVLETTDFAAADLLAELTAQCTAARTERFAGVAPATLAAALEPALRTPLGPAGEPPLAAFTRTDRRDELSFELPLAGGERPTGAGRVAAIADLLRRHLPPADPLAGYADDLAALGGRRLRGFLTGSLDLVLRLRSPGGAPSYLVVDYKTNLLGPRETLTTAHYSGAAMAAAMRASHYPLQALLYGVALHRYLRWRQPGYDPAQHLAGTAYLFLRGMAGPVTPVADGLRCGVFRWRPPAALVTDLSDLLARGEPR